VLADGTPGRLPGCKWSWARTYVPELLAMAGADRIVIHQATGVIAPQLDDTIANAQARLRRGVRERALDVRYCPGCGRTAGAVR
jgi:hypothetical protein